MRTLAIVLAGGQGHRFWPKSSQAYPKQFLNLFGDRSLLQATVGRLGRLLPVESIYVVTTADHEHLVRLQAPDIPSRNVLVEPVGRDTAAAIGYACTLLGEQELDSVALVVPSDHYVADEEAWARTVGDACAAAADGRTVLVGVPPTRPETCYGYILLSEEVARPGSASEATRFYKVARFIEKPSRDLAERLIAGNRCLWNSGMFIWKVGTFLELIRRYLPATAAALSEVAGMRRERGAPPEGSPAWRSRVGALLARLTPVSVDYGVVEKVPDAVVALGSFDWDDVGSWEALTRLLPGDPKGNVTLGPALLHETRDCIVDWNGGPAVVVGLDGAVVAGSGDHLLVCARDRLGQLKAVLAGREYADTMDLVRRGRRERTPSGAQVVLKPWGREVWWALTDHYAAKTLEMSAGHKTSLHVHERKEETLHVLAGQGRLVVGGEVVEARPGTVRTIPPGTPHRIFAFTELTILEVSTPELEDGVRLDDDYGRAQPKE
ncbi:MAG: cupin domain-containing protein [Firmicutes bacterium]|nr:cupin domain-containing protein [Bacillota bacterium]